MVSFVSLTIIIGSFILPFWKKLSVCHVVIITNFFLYFLMVGAHILSSGVVSDTPSRQVIEELGYSQSTFLQRPYTLLTALYVHGSVIHVMMNMLFLALIGAPFEDRVGAKLFFLIYILSGTAASLFSGIFTPNVYGIGASGAIFGIMGAFALKYPHDEIPFFLIFIFLPRVPVYIAVFTYGGIETAYAASGIQDGVGHMAHVGGLVAGIFLATAFLRKEVKEEKYFDSIIFKEIADETKNEDYMRIAIEIEKADEEDVRNAWLEEFFEKVKCPRCTTGKLRMDKEGIKCGCGYLKRFKDFKKERNK